MQFIEKMNNFGMEGIMPPKRRGFLPSPFYIDCSWHYIFTALSGSAIGGEN
jgi:hypothetical protein